MGTRTLTGFALAVALAIAVPSAKAQTSILNASYGVSRELYKDINPSFVADWMTKTGEKVEVNQSHGGSSKQALSVLNGLEADVVTMNQATDIEVLAENGLVAKDWRDKFPHNASPYTTISVFLVRKGNPKDIKDWDDLIRNDVEVIVPNPKTSGNGRYTYLAAWGDALLKGGTDDDARAFVVKLFKNVPVLDGGGRGATTTFTQRDIGDVLVTFENEAILIGKELGADKFEVIYPSTSVEAAPPVAVVDAVVDKRGSILIGSGLTMVDVLLNARREGFAGKTTIVSRRGQLPREHAAKGVVPKDMVLPKTKSLARLAASIRIACEAAEAYGTPWQAVINGLRPSISTIWRQLDVAEQSRFLRHVRPFWDTHRHRLPPEVYRQLHQELDRGRARLLRARVVDVERSSPGFVVNLRRHGTSAVETLKTDLAFDCRGYRPDLRSTLIRGLIGHELARADPHNLGLVVEPDGQVLGARNVPTPGLYALGPLCQGSLWEITAVPEIVRQADLAASRIARLLPLSAASMSA